MPETGIDAAAVAEDRIALWDGVTELSYRELVASPPDDDPRPFVVVPRPRIADVVALWRAWRGGRPVVVRRRAGGPVPSPPPGSHTLVPTTGSRGDPKDVVLTAGNVAAAVAASNARLGTAPGVRWLCVLPLFHVGGLAVLWRTASVGGTVVLHERFDAARVAADLRRVDVVSLVPTMLRRVLAADRGPYPGTLVLLGGAAAPPDLVDAAFDAGLVPLPTYGATEACSQIATVDPSRAWEERHTVGRPLPGVDVTLSPEGEILVAGPTVSPGYAGRPPRRGPHRTGDRGRFDDEGRLVVLGRIDRMIVSGGENVRPEAVEEEIRSWAGVDDAAVVGLPDPDWGTVVAALVEGGGTPDELARLARTRLEPHERPRRWIVGRLPRHEGGKIDYAAVAAAFEEGD